MANTITFFRIAASIVLLSCPVFSHAFYVFYIAAGVSDMLDGFVARKTNTASKFGARLDMIPVVPLKYSAIVVCAVATFAAIQEGHFIRTERE
ncbi:MAG: CDP-alcohol phosphatidyltransferase family protein [Lachnospiraceae bacterium]|nr:CDP-alcohol phosphatidyltransferase family protein [Lachnospiraceae bacterium]